MHAVWAACALAVVIAGAMHWHLQRRPELDGGFRRPVLALEVAETVQRADSAVSAGGGTGAVRSGVYRDYAFIAFYVALFAALGWALGRDVPPGLWGWLALAGIVCAAAAGTLDLLENARILAYTRAVDAGAERTALLDAMRATSLLKWGAFFLAVALLAAPLLRHGEAFSALGALFLLVAAAGACGLAAYRPAMEWAFTLALGGAVPSAVAIWALWPRT